MDPVLVAAVAAVVVLALAVVVGSARARAARRHQALEAELAASRAAVAELRDHVQVLTAAVSRVRPEAPSQFVITTLPGDGGDGTSVTGASAPAHAGPDRSLPVEPVRVDAREFAAVAVGESVVRVVSLAHGVRRALSPVNRNRIRFEVRREVKRARRQRRRDLKEAKRQLRSHVGDAA